jgi:hypothetical protein
MDRVARIVAAFVFVIKSETYAVNHAALKIQREFDDGFDDLDHTVTWEAVYAILTHSATLSRIFWPAPRPRTPEALAREMAARGKALRDAFQVSDGSPLRDRTVRNGFEHMDEAMHSWFEDEKLAMVDQFIGTAEDFRKHTAGKYVFRSFDHVTGIVTVGGTSTALRPLIRESDRLYERWREISGLPPHPASTATPVV